MARYDDVLMQAALALARRGLGQTWPNPSVAALVVDERFDPPVMLGRGRTSPGGRPHAEANALAEAGAAARGATLIVILEPCARRSQRVFGLSCTEHILEAGIARVVIGAPDPSPFASGEGATRLREAGVQVVTGVLESEALAINRGHCLRLAAHRPFVTLKLAQTADGFAGALNRRPLPITGEAARAFVHRLRASHDALLTGIGTVLADDPRLDVRLPGMADLSPLRVVLDTHGRLPADARLLTDAAPACVLIMSATALENRELLPASAETLACPKADNGHLDLAAVLGALAARGITRLMVEAGPTLADAFAKAGFVDEFALLTAPHKVGEGLLAIGPSLAEWLATAHVTGERLLGNDRLTIYEARHRCSPE
ncbi:RibD Pyrimidine reductase, riboflavin biosynthesis [Rhabdaerophilaceae bacterium]